MVEHGGDGMGGGPFQPLRHTLGTSEALLTCVYLSSNQVVAKLQLPYASDAEDDEEEEEE
jgi:hypothetical protein